MAIKLDLTGQTFHHLTVVERGENYKTFTRWKCICVCGNETLIETRNLRGGFSKSCGCLSNQMRAENNPNNNGNTRDLAYKPWQMMKQRCLNPKYYFYKYYGARGIKIHESFMDFQTFLEHIGPRPSLAYTLDRIDNDKGYEPGNVRWATRLDQSLNRGINRVFKLGTTNYTLKDFSEMFGKSISFFRRHLVDKGEDIAYVIQMFKLKRVTDYQTGGALTF